MKLFIAGVRRGHGVGKESRKAYDMNTAMCLEPVKPGQLGGMTVEGYGYEMIELPMLGEGLIHKLKDVRLPGVFEVVIETKPVFGKYVATLTDVIVAPNQKAA